MKDLMDPDGGSVVVVIAVWCTQVNSNDKCAQALQSIKFVFGFTSIVFYTSHTATTYVHIVNNLFAYMHNRIFTE